MNKGVKCNVVVFINNDAILNCLKQAKLFFIMNMFVVANEILLG